MQSIVIFTAAFGEAEVSNIGYLHLGTGKDEREEKDSAVGRSFAMPILCLLIVLLYSTK